MNHGTCKIFTVEFETKKEANDFIDQLGDIVEKTGYATLGDACDAYGFTQFPKDNWDKKILGTGSLNVVVRYEVSIPYDFEED